MYKIIATDQKEYGPVSGEQIQSWIREGRVNAQTQACLEGSAEWKPIGEFPEFAAAFVAAPAPLPPSFPAGASESLTAQQVLSRDYDLDIGSCISRSWELVKKNFWPVVGVTALIILVMGVINQVFGLFTRAPIIEMIREHRFMPGSIFLILGIGVITTPIYTVLMAGLFKYYFKLIRGENATVADAFSGFGPSLGQLVLLGLVQSVLIQLGFLFCIIPGLYLSVAWYFALPLVIDRNMNFWDAMELSRKVITKHWFLFFGFLIVLGLIYLLGFIACCIGIFVSLPVAAVSLLYAYEDIFGRPKV